jgi:hypothetical protein
MFTTGACQKKQDTVVEVAQTEKDMPATRLDSVSAPRDTVYETAYIDKQRFYDTTSLKVGNDVYLSLSEAYSLNDSSIVEVEEWDDKAIHKNKYHNNIYKLKLLKNGLPVFTKTYTKHDFYKLEKDNPYIRGSVPRPLELKGITTEGKLIFTLLFGFPDSDVGGITTLVTNSTGTPILLQNYNHLGGGGCDAEMEVSKDRKYYLNCETLYGPNGYEFNYSKSDVVYASFLTDTSFVVIYDYLIKSGERMENGVKQYFEERDTISDNVIFFHVNGTPLGKDVYRGFFQELGYTTPVEFVDKHFVTFDGRKREVTIYPNSNPQVSKKILLSTGKKLKQRIKNPAVKELEFRTYEGTFYLYLFPDEIQYFKSQE